MCASVVSSGPRSSPPPPPAVKDWTATVTPTLGISQSLLSATLTVTYKGTSSTFDSPGFKTTMATVLNVPEANIFVVTVSTTAAQQGRRKVQWVSTNFILERQCQILERFEHCYDMRTVQGCIHQIQPGTRKNVCFQQKSEECNVLSVLGYFKQLRIVEGIVINK